jgi:hypothetical protein
VFKTSHHSRFEIDCHAKAVDVALSKLRSILRLQVSRTYEPIVQRGRAGTKISIDLEPVPDFYAAPEQIPSRLGGVYRILDADRTDIDIGCSKNDVRGRVSTKWRHEKEALSVLVYVLGAYAGR